MSNESHSQNEIKLHELFAAQQEIVHHPARFKVLACGRRFGKTQIALELICNHLMERHSCAYFAPSHIMTFEVWEAIKMLMSPLISRVRETESRIELINGGLFECWTARTEAVRGRKYHFVVIDEAALIPDASVWHAAIRPLLADYRGSALFASTPRGRNWFWQLYNRRDEGWHSWSFPTATNPFIEAAEVEDARRSLPERVFQQEFLAEFLEDGGAVFRNIETVCQQPVADTAGRCVFGVDWGRDYDFTAISVMDTSGNQLFLERFNQVSYNLQRDRLSLLYDRFKPVVILAESNSVGAVNIDALRADGLPVEPFTTTAQSKMSLVEKLSLAMEKGEVKLLDDEVLKYELQIYQMSRTPHGNWYYSAPPGEHDDTVIATALSYWASQRYSGILFDFVESPRINYSSPRYWFTDDTEVNEFTHYRVY